MRSTAFAITLLCASVLSAQSVQLINTSRQGASNFYVGDTWEIDISGPPNQPVAVTATHNGQTGTSSYGYTDQSGSFVLTGLMPESAVGSWTEVWTVGGVAASPTLEFTVEESPLGGCQTFAVTSPPWMYSTDFYSLSDLIFTMPGSSLVSGQIVSGLCAIAHVDLFNMGYPFYISADISNYGAVAFGMAYDNQTTGAYGFASRCFNCFYPIVQTGVVEFIAIDAAFNVYFFQTAVVLWIDRADL